MKILVVIDMQNDFVSGSLGSTQAMAIVDGVANEILKEDYDEVFFTRDTHNDLLYLSTLEGKHLPVKHCIEGTYGWQIEDTIAKALNNNHINSYPIDKYHFGSTKLVRTVREDILDCEETSNEVYICGLCTDICVIANAVLLQNALAPQVIDINVIEHLCAGTTPEKHKEAIDVMKSLQINIV